MGLDLSGYPPTESGAQSMIEALTPRIVQMWKAERTDFHTDDLVAMINASSNQVTIDPRTTVYQRVKKHDPTLELLGHITRQPSQVNGTVTIWAIIGFPKGQLCVLPLVVAYS